MKKMILITFSLFLTIMSSMQAFYLGLGPIGVGIGRGYYGGYPYGGWGRPYYGGYYRSYRPYRWVSGPVYSRYVDDVTDNDLGVDEDADDVVDEEVID